MDKEEVDDGVFILICSLQFNPGGSIIAHNISLSESQDSVNKDPFIEENIVSTDILEIDPKKADDRLNSLIG